MASVPGCGLPIVKTLCGAAGSLAGDAVNGIFGSVADDMAKGLAKAITVCMTFWTDVKMPGLSGTSGPVGNMFGALGWITAAVAVFCTLIAAGKLALSARSAAATQVARGFLILAITSGLVVPVVMLLSSFADSYSTWIIAQAGSGALGARMAVMVAAMGPLGPGLIFVISILGIIACFIQLALMLVRVAAIVLLTGTLPVVGAATMTGGGMKMFTKQISWLLAFIVYKPLAAIVYASAFWLIGTGKDPTLILSGLALMGLAILAMPALLRLLEPMVEAVHHSGGAAAEGAAAASGAASTGAKVVGRIPGIQSLKGGSSGPAEGAQQPPTPTWMGMGSAGGSPTGAGAAGASGAGAAGGAGGSAAAAGGAGAAAGPVGAGVAAAASAAKSAANGAAQGAKPIGGDK